MMNFGKIKKKNMKDLAMITFAVAVLVIAFRLVNEYNND
jgi:hypothetical protein